MLVYVDDQPLECALASGGTVEELIGVVRAEVSSPQRMLVGIRADGEEIGGSAREETLERPADSFSRYDFVTGEPSSVVREALSCCEALLDDAEQTRREVIERLTRGESAEGLAKLGECCSAWRQVHTGIEGAMRLLKIDASQMSVGGRGLPESLADMKAPLEQIRAALVARDFVHICDVLQYEFDPVIGNWRSVLASLRQATAG